MHACMLEGSGGNVWVGPSQLVRKSNMPWSGSGELMGWTHIYGYTGGMRKSLGEKKDLGTKKDLGALKKSQRCFLNWSPIQVPELICGISNKLAANCR